MKIKRAEFIGLSASTMMLTALGIDIMLPVFGEIRKHFSLPPESTATAQIIVFFFLGQIAQIAFGILSDRFGRLAILRIGFPLYIVGGIFATFASTIELMFAYRFIAGVGASAVFMATIAGVRDRFVGDAMARTMSLILTIFLFTPIFAPFLGIAILSVSSWKMVFLTPPLFGVLVFIWSFRLEESFPEEKRSKINWRTVTRSLSKVMRNAVFLRYTSVTTFLFAGLSCYVSSSERIVSEIYGRPDLFIWIFAGIGLLMSLCALVNAKLSARFGAKRTLRTLLIVYAIVGANLLLYTLTAGDPPDMNIFFLAVALLMAINIAIEPNSSALALEPMGDVAGLAASLYGTLFFFVGAAMGALISNLMVAGVMSLVIGFFVIGMVTLLLVVNDSTKKDRTVLSIRTEESES